MLSTITNFTIVLLKNILKRTNNTVTQAELLLLIASHNGLFAFSLFVVIWLIEIIVI